jgi:hypothetical protein
MDRLAIHFDLVSLGVKEKAGVLPGAGAARERTPGPPTEDALGTGHNLPGMERFRHVIVRPEFQT